MKKNYLLFYLAAALLISVGAVQAQVPSWAPPTIGSNSQLTGESVIQATAVDSRGNVFVTGYFKTQATFGTITLTSPGYQSTDLFVAKYVPSTGTWAWAQRGGGADNDYGFGIAVSGNNVYVVGNITNNRANAAVVLFGGTGATTGTMQQSGASTAYTSDLVVAKYTDNGTTGTLKWTQVAGGTEGDIGYGVAVNANSVYVTGSIVNNTANAQQVVFGGSGTTPGTSLQYGTTSTTDGDIVLAKYTDNGTSATFNWSQVGGGTLNDSGNGVAVNGTNVYLVGSMANNTANAMQVVFGGSGTTPGTAVQYGASTSNTLYAADIVVAKYTDNGSSATLSWTQVAGGSSNDFGQSIAVSGANVYVAGSLTNNRANDEAVVFGGSGTAPGTFAQYGAATTRNFDLFVAKYIDNGPSATVGWTQVGGGIWGDTGHGVAVSGSSVYVTGNQLNNLANSNAVLFGGSGTTAGTAVQVGATSTSSFDLVLAKYTDNGPNATLKWTKVGGSPAGDGGYGVSVSGQNVYVGGLISAPAAFGSFTTASPGGNTSLVLAQLVDPTLTPLASASATAGSHLNLYPNPTAGLATATLTGAGASSLVEVFNTLGQLVVTATASQAGIATLPARLPAGVYTVRNGKQALRWAVE